MFNLACPVFCQQVYHHINEKQIKSFLFVHVVSISSLSSMMVLVCWNFFTFRLNSLIFSKWQLISNCSLSCLFYQKLSTCLTAQFWRMKIYKSNYLRRFTENRHLYFHKTKMHKIITVSICDDMVYNKILDQKMLRKRGRYIIKLTLLNFFRMCKCVVEVMYIIKT